MYLVIENRPKKSVLVCFGDLPMITAFLAHRVTPEMLQHITAMQPHDRIVCRETDTEIPWMPTTGYAWGKFVIIKEH